MDGNQPFLLIHVHKQEGGRMKKIVGIVQEHMFAKDEIRRFESGLKEI